MDNIISMLNFLSLNMYIAFFMGISMLNIILIIPIFFNLKIIPEIENRYKSCLKINEYVYHYELTTCVRWGVLPLEVSLYIVSKYIGWRIKGVCDPISGTISFKLKALNYEIKDATRLEIFMSFVSILSVIIFFVGGAKIHFYP